LEVDKELDDKECKNEVEEDAKAEEAGNKTDGAADV
jgi:hypothetical protein